MAVDQINGPFRQKAANTWSNEEAVRYSGCYAVLRFGHELVDCEPSPREALDRRGVGLGLHLRRVVGAAVVHRPLLVLHLLQHLKERVARWTDDENHGWSEDGNRKSLTQRRVCATAVGVVSLLRFLLPILPSPKRHTSDGHTP